MIGNSTAIIVLSVNVNVNTNDHKIMNNYMNFIYLNCEMKK